ncbi:MAG TPA: hypothetical protein VG894_00620 [Bauldia sp.]|nr:hypothetical protein [Bauldia sp.]
MTLRVCLAVAFGAALAIAAGSGAFAAGSAPPGFDVYHLNGPKSQPVTQDGVTTFHITPGDCNKTVKLALASETDCSTRSVHGNIHRTRDAKLGESFEYAFDVWTDPGFVYPGLYRTGNEALPYRPGGWDSQLRIATWEGPYRKDFIYMLKLDATKGYTFMGKECAPPSAFGQWVHFSMKVHWANDSTGWVKVTCDDRVVYLAEGVATTKQTQCYVQNECLPGTVHDPKTINFLLGPALLGDGSRAKETGHAEFVKLQPDGINMKMRNIVVSENATLYGLEETALVKQLQESLSKLGCLTSPATGAIDADTRQQAILCRDFPNEAKPDQLTVDTVKKFAELYSLPNVADLPKGTPVAPPPYIIHIAARDDHPKIHPDTIYTFNSLIEQPSGELVPINFIVMGQFDQGRGDFADMELLIDADVGKAAKALASCPAVRLEDHGDEGTVLVFGLGNPIADTFRFQNLSCVLDPLSPALRYKIEFVVDHFRELASTLVNENSLIEIDSKNMQTFIKGVAAGKIILSRAN